MPTRQFDGATLEEALTKARDELGADIRITGAEKVRSGGIAGFFARERVEVSVEVDDDTAAAAANEVPSDAIATPVSLLDLADSISQADEFSFAASAVVTEPDGDSDTEVALPAAGSSFASVLERISNQAELAVAAQTAEPAPAPTASAATTAEGVFSFAPQPEVEAEVAVEVEADVELAVEVEPEPEVESDPLAAFAALARRTPKAPEPPDTTTTTTTPPNSLQWTTDSVVHCSEFETPGGTPGVASDLEQLGVPGALVPPYAGGDLYQAMVARLEMLPVVPELPRTRGSVVVVVGPRAEAAEVAADLALEVRTHPRDVVVCSADPADDLVLTTVEEAETERRSWRRRLEPTVVVVDAPVGPADQDWVRDVVAALEPHAVWGVVDGGRKVEDLAAWYDVVGGVDVLAVTGVRDTTTPASVLHLGLPVAMLDGEPASPELWAEILLDRLAA